MIGGLQDNSTIWHGRHRRAGRLEERCFRSATARRRRASIRRAPACCSPASRATASSRTSRTAISRAGCAPTIRSAPPTSARRITASTGRQFISFDEVQSRHAVHRVPARVAHEEQRRQPGGARGELPVHRRPGGAGVRRLGAARRRVPVRRRARRRTRPAASPAISRATSTAPIAPAASSSRPSARAGDAGTLWAATSLGRLFVSKNADAAGPDVDVHAHRHAGDAQPLRHAHRRRSPATRMSRSSPTRASTR